MTDSRDRSDAGGNEWPALVTFDFYGTLVQNRTEAESRFDQILRWNRGSHLETRTVYSRWLRIVSDLQHGPFQRYRDICELALERVLAEHGLKGRARDIEHYFEGFSKFPLWPETEPVLEELSRNFAIGIITNCDNDLFALTPKPPVPIRFFFTSENARGYKADGALFRYVLREASISAGDLMHSGQSQRTDLIGAKPLGITCAWINRYGLNRDADVPEPDFVFSDLKPLPATIKQHAKTSMGSAHKQ